ncbi:hypothetical protein RclHR1_26350001 [Rhizophagus clarus]|uniref:SAM domain-containing protein n=1 Tax=Rhizophagus clarus TaxID=94130 RepID=A0A2Z6R0G6_9GLOM|nr:hypothetical protein RclHR1_26350001 [Rhizophagus clarus]
MSTEIDSLPVEDWDTETFITFLRRQNLKFDDDDFEILRREKITGFDFTNMTKEEFERCGLKIGPSRRLVEIAEILKGKSKCSFTLHSLKEVLEEYNINPILPGTYPLENDDEQGEGKIKISKGEGENTSTLSPPPKKSSLPKRCIGTQTKTVSSDPKSLTYLIQGLISRSIAHFVLDERMAFVGGVTKGLDESKTKLIDNVNYVIEFVELPDFAELVISRQDIPDSSTLTRTVATQTKPLIEDTKALTYIAKGIMFKSICWFGWDEQKAFCLGKKKGKLRLVSIDPKLASVTLTCNYQLSMGLCNFDGDIGHPMIVSCSYGSVKTLLTQDKKRIMDNLNYNLTILS